MRLLFAIPHFFRPISGKATNRSGRPDAREERAAALVATIAALRQTFGESVYGLDHGERIAWRAAAPHQLDIVVCTTGGAHLLDDLPALRPLFEHYPTEVEPTLLGFACHRVLADARGRYDYYGYIEDDIVVTDPLFFQKRDLFDNHFEVEALLQPNRWEAKSSGALHKLYVDYRLRPSVTATYQNIYDQPHLEMAFLAQTIRFERTPYPSAGCFFLSQEQVPLWVDAPAFCDGDVSYMSPLDSAATLSVMKTFRIYKPILDQAWFFEVQHASPRWVNWATDQVRLAPSTRSRDEGFREDRLP